MSLKDIAARQEISEKYMEQIISILNKAGYVRSIRGAQGGYLLRKISIWLVPIPTVLANAIIVPFVLKYAYNAPDAVPLMMLTVGVGELIAAFGLGMTLYFALKPHEKRLFKPFT